MQIWLLKQEYMAAWKDEKSPVKDNNLVDSVKVLDLFEVNRLSHP